MEDLKYKIENIEKRLLVMDRERNDLKVDVKTLAGKIDTLVAKLETYISYEKELLNNKFVKKDECYRQVRKTETFMNRIIGAIIIASFIITILVKFL